MAWFIFFKTERSRLTGLPQSIQPAIPHMDTNLPSAKSLYPHVPFWARAFISYDADGILCLFAAGCTRKTSSKPDFEGRTARSVELSQHPYVQYGHPLRAYVV